MKRSPLVRTPGSPSLTIKSKKRVCKQCRAEFVTFSTLQCWCSPTCGALLAEAALAKKKASAAKAERRADMAKRESLLTIPELKALAQKEFNAFIRFRDRNLPCICCGRFKNEHSLTGSVWDAGHYRSTGSADHLRFNEDNCHRQLVQCNRHGAGRAVDYRIGLIKRIGLERVEALEASNEIVKWTREKLIEIRNIYRQKLKELKAKEGAC